jgi:HEAT repeat protein
MTAPLMVSEGERRRALEVERLLRDRAIGELIERLTDPSWTVRRAIVSALARLGDPAIGPLCDVLRFHRDDEGRLAAAVDALVASLGHVDDAVLALADSSNAAVVCDVAQILGRRRSTAAMPTLARLAEDPNDNVALAAIEAVGRIGGQAAIDLLVAAVESRSFFRAFPAIDVLGRTGDPRAVGPLCDLLTEPHYAIEATRALGRAGQPAAASALAALLGRPNDAQVRVAAAALVEIHDRYTAQFGPHRAVLDALASIDSSAASRRLTQSLVGADPAERTALCRVLGWVGGSNAARALVELLDAEPSSAEAAAMAIASLERQAEPILFSALHESSEDRRLILLPILARGRTAAPEILECLDDLHASVRAVACDTLGKIGDASAVGALFERLGDPDARVSQAAVGAIQSLGSDETESRALRAARSDEPRVRRSALRILSYFGWPSALEVFLGAMDDSDERLRDLAASGLAGIGDPRSLDALLAASEHAAPRTRAAAMRALGLIHDGPRVRDRLRAALADADPWVRYYACQAVSKHKDEGAAEAVGPLLLDPAGHVRVAAIEALAQLRGERALEALHAATLSPDADVQRAALLGIARVRSPASLEIVRRGSASPDAATRLVALSALAEFDGPEVVAGLLAALSDSDESVRSAAITLLGSRAGTEATAALVERLDHPGLRSGILVALSTWTQGRIEGLKTALRTATAEQAPVIVSALARLRRADATAALEEAFGFDNEVARRAVVPALAALRTPSARKLLERGSLADPDAQVRQICAAVLSG